MLISCWRMVLTERVGGVSRSAGKDFTRDRSEGLTLTQRQVSAAHPDPTDLSHCFYKARIFVQLDH
ncbi:MAG: hypothetical protein RL610_21 [Pseudomonadota bacterium]